MPRLSGRLQRPTSSSVSGKSTRSLSDALPVSKSADGMVFYGAAHIL